MCRPVEAIWRKRGKANSTGKNRDYRINVTNTEGQCNLQESIRNQLYPTQRGVKYLTLRTFADIFCLNSRTRGKMIYFPGCLVLFLTNMWSRELITSANPEDMYGKAATLSAVLVAGPSCPQRTSP